MNEIKTILGEMGLHLGMRLDPEELERLRSQSKAYLRSVTAAAGAAGAEGLGDP